VFGADVTLNSLSDFVDRQRLSDSSILLIFDGDGQLVAHPDKDKLSRVVDGNIEAVQVADLDDPVIGKLMATFTGSDRSEDIQTIIEADGERYVARVTRMPLVDGADWYLAFVVPVKDFIAPIIKTGTWSFLISLVAAALVIPILVLAARLISKPLNELVHEADAIRDFRLDEPVTVHSRVKEVQHLTEAIATTKSALQTFGRYVPKALVKQLVQSGEVAEVGGQRRIVTLMFSDIANFTGIVEDMPPEALMQQMSAYLQELGGSVLKRGGTIDKYIGDAIMAFWNAPLPDFDHAYNACVAALECQNLSARLNEEWQRVDQPVLRTRFGLHLGEAVVGNVGSPDRMDYTAIGASVNLAARLEGLNKFYRTQILVSEAVVEAVHGRVLVRPVDLVLPKGAAQPVEIFELAGTIGETSKKENHLRASDVRQEFFSTWEAAYRAYRSRDWRAATTAFSDLREAHGNDHLVHLYAGRAEKYLKSPPSSDWNGVEVFETK
ncbi:MAG: adenylate/guanylate cyclase domain-containing protein, partial [Geminicoccaceae bacterium]